MFSSEKQIREIFSHFSGVKVLIIGDVMIDAYLQGKVDRISPEAPVPVVTLNSRTNMLGGAANVALNIKALGAVPVLCSVIGDDTQAEEFLNLLKKEEILPEGIIRAGNRITTTKYRIIGNKMQMLRMDDETDTDISAAQQEELLLKVRKLLEEHQPSVIIIEDYNKGVLTRDVISGIIGMASSLNIPTVVDPKKKNFESYKNITLFKPNLKEIREGLKIDVDPASEESLAKAAGMIHELQKVEMVMITLSEEGVFISSNGVHKRIKAHVRPIADVSGAGDTVISVAALCISQHLKAEEIAVLSNLAGGIVCEQVGVIPIHLQTLLREAISSLINTNI
jgi:D-glycero-beta-D-manno-heptose-7-phosphate kinase